MNDAGKAMILPKGKYNPTVSYEVYDSVYENGIAYVAKRNVTGILPSSDDGTYWMKWVDFNPVAEQAAESAASGAAAQATTEAESWAHGGTATRVDEDTDNSKYYSEKSKEYMEAAQAASEIAIPQFYIDFETGCLMSESGAIGFIFYIQDGDFYGEVA